MKRFEMIAAAALSIGVALGALMAAAPVAPAKAPAKPVAKPAAKTKVSVVGLSIARAKPGDKYGRSTAGALSAGTHLYLQIVRDDKFFISVDKKATTLEIFADDKGRELALPGPAERWELRWLGTMLNSISADGHTYSFSVQATKRIPTPGSKALKVKATVLILCGSDEKFAEQKDLALKAGTKITVGPVPMTIKEVREQKWGKETNTLITMESNKSFDPIKQIKFFDADGKRIPGRRTGSGHFGMLGKYTYTRTISLSAKADKATLKMAYFGKTEKLKVPVDVSVGLGL